ncbi:hypothetical protein AB0H58_14640 [Nocardia neocaledoniensis]|uniref:hypothetical protein n=1 Tax=Nocardia neocaledoniensis TaxID=236511 RepID=UPI0033CF5EA0
MLIARAVLTLSGMAGMPLSDYVREELITSARRGTVDDAVLEIREALGDGDLPLDMAHSTRIWTPGCRYASSQLQPLPAPGNSDRRQGA